MNRNFLTLFNSKYHFIMLLTFFSLSYCLIEWLLIPHLILVFDEFWFAQHIYHYTYLMPYRDFLPYKTTLGYYLLSLPFFVSHSLLQPIFLIKSEIAFINTIAMTVCAYFSTRFFNPRAIIISLILLVINQLFLLYSVDLRVDMLSSWFGLFSLMLILYRKHYLAGLMLGISFLCSQKALWFAFAINVAYLAIVMVMEKKHQNLKAMFTFNLSFIVTVGIYFAIWSLLVNPTIVWNSMFYEAYTQANIHWYSQVYTLYWKFILANGCLLIMLMPLTWITLFFTPIRWERIFIAVSGSVMVCLIVGYQQPFPYNTVFLVPVFFLVYSDFITQLFGLSDQSILIKPLTNVSTRWLIVFISIYLILLFVLFIYFEVGLPYYLILCIPVFFSLTIYKNRLMMTLLLLAIFFTGIFYPLIRTIEYSVAANNDYQKFNLALLNDLLKNDGDYVAGTPMLYTKKQAIIGLENLISPAIAYLYHPSPKLLPILIPSLYLFPVSQENIIEQLKTKPVKIYVNNTRMKYLPEVISTFLRHEFSHFWGSLYIYSPQIDPINTQFFLKFDGNYQILGSDESNIFIDKRRALTNSTIRLQKGFHLTKTNDSYRLKLIPEHLNIFLERQYYEDKWKDSVK